MSRFLELLEDSGYDEEYDNPLEKMNTLPNFKTILSAVIQDILEKYSGIFCEAIDKGIKFDFESCIIIPHDNIEFSLLDQIDEHKDNMEII